MRTVAGSNRSFLLKCQFNLTLSHFQIKVANFSPTKLLISVLKIPEILDFNHGSIG